MRVIGVVARHEFTTFVRSWQFLGMTLGLPAIWVVVTAVGVAAMSAREMQAFEVVVIADSLELRDDVVERLQEPVIVVDRGTTSPVALDALVRERSLAAWIEMDHQGAAEARATWHGVGAPTRAAERVVRDALYRRALERILGDRLAQVEQLEATADVVFEDLDRAPDERDGRHEGARYGVAMVGLVLIGLPLMLYTSVLTTTTVREREEGIAEVMVCAIRPDHLLFGKVVGVGAIAALHILCWLIPTAAAIAWLLPLTELAEAPVYSASESASLLGALLLTGLAGYAILATSLTALTAAVPKEWLGRLISALALASYIIFPVVASALSDPFAPTPVALSYLPPFAPFVMWVRFVAGAGFGEVLACVALTLLFSAGAGRLGGRLYRLGR